MLGVCLIKGPLKVAQYRFFWGLRYCTPFKIIISQLKNGLIALILGQVSIGPKFCLVVVS